jgi:hypothetical protein
MSTVENEHPGPSCFRRKCLRRGVARGALCAALLALGCTGEISKPGQHAAGGGSGAIGVAGGNGVSGGSGQGGSAGGPLDPNGVGWTSRVPRLTHSQWENTTRDLLRLADVSGISASFSPDPTTRFDTSIEERKVSPGLWQDYQRAAESLAKQVARDPAALARILPAGLPAADPARARAFVTSFGGRAFRRPLTMAEIDVHTTLFTEGVALLGGDALAAGAQMVIAAMLQSPAFIYRIESSIDPSGDRIWLGSYEVASRLSYTLWNTMPPDELLAAAASNALATASGVATWTKTLLDDPRAQPTLTRFHEQVFQVSGFGSGSKDPVRFPTFTSDLEPLLKQEAHLYIEDVIVKNGGGIPELLTTPAAFVSDRTAPFYGLPAGMGSTPRRVDLDPTRRAGLLTQVGFLSKHGGLVQSDPIHRGVIINFNVLCIELQPPPNLVPPLPAEVPGQTNRQRVDAHTRGCGAGCHDRFINPLGFAFEHFDTTGAWRDTDGGSPVDAKASYTLDGKSVTFDGAPELARLLAASTQVHECYARNWLGYALGREVSAAEEGAVKQLAGASHAGSGAKDLLARIAVMDLFRARSVKEAP